MKRLITVAALAALLVPVVALGGSAKSVTFKAAMYGKNEVPKGAPKGYALSTVTFTGAKVCWAFTAVSGISKETAAHIHKGKAGTAGPIVIPFGGAYKAKGCTTTLPRPSPRRSSPTHPATT